MPDFYAYTSPKLYAVILRILNDAPESERAMTTLYTQIFSLTQQSAFRPSWSDLIKLARRHALDHKLAGKPLSRDASHSENHKSGSATSFDFNNAQGLNTLSSADRLILKQVLDNKNPKYEAALDALTRQNKPTSQEGGRS